MKSALSNCLLLCVMSSVFVIHKDRAGEFEGFTYTVNFLKHEMPKVRKSIEGGRCSTYKNSLQGSLAADITDEKSILRTYSYIRIGFSDGVSATLRKVENDTKSNNRWFYEQVGYSADQNSEHQVESVGLDDVPDSFFKKAVFNGEPLCLAPLTRKLKKS